MSLVEDNIEVIETEQMKLSAAIEKWQHFPVSTISHHGEECCRIAREWILSMDYSQLDAGNPHTGPRWLRGKYKWGPSLWPIYWCEAVKQKKLDCGALAALTHEVFFARGIRSYPAQFIQQYTKDATRQWHERWEIDGVSVHWINDDLIYHEGCAVIVGEHNIKIWDPSAGWWLNQKQSDGYGGLVALRIFVAENVSSVSFHWGTHRIIPNLWQKLEGGCEDTLRLSGFA